ncbi:MAG: response regulator transcription factor [Caulobacteraceae bacterium]|nr:response regulator transcription factor [Caulobacteraceae bacterium]
MRLVIADDHDLVRDALCELVRRGDPHGVVATAGSLDGVVEVLRNQPEFDLLLLDLVMPGIHGVSSIVRFVEENAGKKVVLMSGQASSVDIVRAMRGGVRGFIPKTLAGTALVSALRLIDVGETYFPANLFVVGGRAQPELSLREQEVVAELRRGRTNKEIAKHLDLDEVTVKSTLRSAGVKLGARGRTDIALKSLKLVGDVGFSS